MWGPTTSRGGHKVLNTAITSLMRRRRRILYQVSFSLTVEVNKGKYGNVLPQLGN